MIVGLCDSGEWVKGVCTCEKGRVLRADGGRVPEGHQQRSAPTLSGLCLPTEVPSHGRARACGGCTGSPTNKRATSRECAVPHWHDQRACCLAARSMAAVKHKTRGQGTSSSGGKPPDRSASCGVMLECCINCNSEEAPCAQFC